MLFNFMINGTCLDARETFLGLPVFLLAPPPCFEAPNFSFLSMVYRCEGLSDPRTPGCFISDVGRHVQAGAIALERAP